MKETAGYDIVAADEIVPISPDVKSPEMPFVHEYFQHEHTKWFFHEKFVDSNTGRVRRFDLPGIEANDRLPQMVELTNHESRPNFGSRDQENDEIVKVYITEHEKYQMQTRLVVRFLGRIGNEHWWTFFLRMTNKGSSPVMIHNQIMNSKNGRRVEQFQSNIQSHRPMKSF